MHNIEPYWKALVAFLAPAAAVVGTSVLPESDGGAAITGSEWVTAVVTAVVTAAGVYAKANHPHPPPPIPDGDGEHRA